MRGITTRAFRPLLPKGQPLPPPKIMRAEQSNTSIRFGDRLVLKLIRKLSPGVNPDLEIGRLLTEKRFPHSAPTAGAIDLRLNQDEPMTIAILQGFVTNQGDAWSYTLDRLDHYFEAAMGQPLPVLPAAFSVDLLDAAPPDEAAGHIGDFLKSVRLLGCRTAKMHICLASELSLPEFKPEPFSKLYQRALYQSMRTQAGKVLPLLRRQFNRLPENLRPLVVFVMEHEKDLIDRFKDLLESKIGAMRIRCHGDYHLGQVLFTGNDFIIIDFEGEPARPITERRIKRSALRDVAGMLRSFQYAAHAGVLRRQENGVSPETFAELGHWAEFWQRWVGAEFLKSYLQQASGSKFIPGSRNELRILMRALLLEKAVYELSYELNNRPDWVGIPLLGIRQLLGGNHS
jgi:maltose alpha-D-glucosyltransferase/alpha-amylase